MALMPAKKNNAQGIGRGPNTVKLKSDVKVGPLASNPASKRISKGSSTKGY